MQETLNTLLVVLYEQMELIPDPDPDEEGTKLSVSMWSMAVWYSKLLHAYDFWEQSL